MKITKRVLPNLILSGIVLSISGIAFAFTSVNLSSRAQSWTAATCNQALLNSKDNLTNNEKATICYNFLKANEQQVAINNHQLSIDDLYARAAIPGPQGIQGEKGDKGDTGTQGVQGIQGLPGANALVNKSRIYTNTSDPVSPDEFTTIVEAFCNDDNDVVVSGGYIKDRSPNLEVVSNYSITRLSGNSSWAVGAYSTNGRWPIQATVSCLQVD
jgi:hypothetical protein